MAVVRRLKQALVHKGVCSSSQFTLERCKDERETVQWSRGLKPLNSDGNWKGKHMGLQVSTLPK